MKHAESPHRSVWSWLPTLYVAEALPYVVVNTVTVLLYTRLGIGKTEMAFFTSWLYLPWVIKPLWSPFVDIISTKRRWVLWMQLVMGVAFASVIFLIPTSFFFAATLALFWIAAFCSATHDIAADGYYMLELTPHEQAAYVGWRSTFYRVGLLLGSGALVWLAGCIEMSGVPEGVEPPHNNIVAAWMVYFAVVALLMLGIWFYHARRLPRPATDVVADKSGRMADTWRNFASTFVTFFRKPHIFAALAFMLLYRLPEALCIKMVQPFFVDSPELGGLGMTTSQVGVANGLTGMIGILLGGILGGAAIARNGLKRWLWPMALCLTLPCALYALLAVWQPMLTPGAVVCVNVAVFVEQFGYGFGFTAFMLYLIYFSMGRWKTSHYAFCTAFMALGMMLPGMAAGWLYETLDNVNMFGAGHQGYINFFVFVLLSSVFTFIACLCVKIDPQFGKKKSE